MESNKAAVGSQKTSQSKRFRFLAIFVIIFSFLSIFASLVEYESLQRAYFRSLDFIFNPNLDTEDEGKENDHSKLLKQLLKFDEISDEDRRSIPTQHWQFEPDICQQQQSNSKDEIVVLLWTDFFGMKWVDHFNKTGSPVVFADRLGCDKTCYFTMNHDYLDKAKAVIVHPPDDNVEIGPPRHRITSQRWIMYSFESPAHDHRSMAQNLYSTYKFNWTMTFERTSTIFMPYGQLRQSKGQVDVDVEQVKKRTQEFAQNFSKRDFDAVWIVSNM